MCTDAGEGRGGWEEGSSRSARNALLHVCIAVTSVRLPQVSRIVRVGSTGHISELLVRLFFPPAERVPVHVCAPLSCNERLHVDVIWFAPPVITGVPPGLVDEVPLPGRNRTSHNNWLMCLTNTVET